MASADALKFPIFGSKSRKEVTKRVGTALDQLNESLQARVQTSAQRGRLTARNLERELTGEPQEGHAEDEATKPNRNRR